MKYTMILIFSSMVVFGCANSNKSKVQSAILNAPTPVKKDYGSSDAKAGGVCKPEILSDYKLVQRACRDIQSRTTQECFDAVDTFNSVHPDIDCSGTYNDTTTDTAFHIKTRTTTNPEQVAICKQRASDMDQIRTEAQKALEAKKKTQSLNVKAEMTDFLNKYKESSCTEESNDLFTSEIKQMTDKLDNL